jgi:hypothetical protein
MLTSTLQDIIRAGFMDSVPGVQARASGMARGQIDSLTA